MVYDDLSRSVFSVLPIGTTRDSNLFEASV